MLQDVRMYVHNVTYFIIYYMNSVMVLHLLEKHVFRNLWYIGKEQSGNRKKEQEETNIVEV